MKNQEEKNNAGNLKTLAAMFLSAAGGLAIGILFAPQSGKKTRENIASKANDFAGEMGKKMKEEISMLRNKAESLEKLVENKIQESADALKDKAESFIGKSAK